MNNWLITIKLRRLARSLYRRNGLRRGGVAPPKRRVPSPGLYVFDKSLNVDVETSKQLFCIVPRGTKRRSDET